MRDVPVRDAAGAPAEPAGTGRGGPERPADEPEPEPPPARPFLPRSSRTRAL